MKFVLVSMVLLSALVVRAEDKIKMYYNNEEITKIIESYSKASGQKFVLDPAVRGKVSIFIQEPVTLEEAFNQVSSALAINGFAISKQGDTMVVKSARNIQRDLIEVSKERPAIKPERMYTWVYSFKNVPAEAIMRDLRILVSKDGELVVNSQGNQLIMTDWTSNLNRIGDLMKEVDTKTDPAVTKIVDAYRKQHEAMKKEKNARKDDKKDKAEN